MRLSGVRVPRGPSNIPYVALGIALASIGYGLGRKAYNKARAKWGTRKKKEEPKADMKEEHSASSSATTSTQGETEAHAPAAKTRTPRKKTASPAGHEELLAHKISSDMGTQTPPRKKPVRKSTARKAPVTKQTQNPKNTRPKR